MTDRPVPMKTIVIAVVLAAISVAGCSGPGTVSGDLPAASDEAAQQAAFPALSSIKEASALSTQSNYRAGEEYDAALPATGVEPLLGGMRMDGHSDGGMSYAIYSFDVTGIQGGEPVELDWYPLDKHGIITQRDPVRPDFYLGIADFNSSAWEWRNVSSESVDIGSYSDYAAADGRFLLALVTLSSERIQVKSVRLGPSHWSIEEIDLDQRAGLTISAAVDSSNMIHFSWGTRYVKETESGWVVEDLPMELGPVHKLLIDETDTVHICGTIPGDWGFGLYYYARKTLHGWDHLWGTVYQMYTDPLPGGFFIRNYINMDLDSEGNPHFAFYVEKEGGLYYAGPDGAGEWTEVQVDSAQCTGAPCVITLDSEDVPHIAYHALSSNAGRYAFPDAEGWRIETLLDGETAGVDLISDQQGGLILAMIEGSSYYHDGVTSVLFKGDSWEADDLGYSWGGGCKLLLDSDGMPVLLHETYQNYPLLIDSWTGSGWSRLWVDMPDTVTKPDDACFLLDTADGPHLLFAEESDSGKVIYHASLE